MTTDLNAIADVCPKCGSERYSVDSNGYRCGTVVREATRTDGIRSDKCLLREAAKEIERLRSQLPDGMKDCTIVSKTCQLGHGWLTATNWVQHGCPVCKTKALEAEIERLRAKELTAEDVATIQMARDLLGDGFHREGGTKLTSWDVCGECGADDWAGHRDDCRMKNGISAAESLLAKLKEPTP